MTQRQEALKGRITEEMKAVARDESRTPEFIRDGLARGAIAIPKNPAHKNCRPTGVGEGLRTKVNANIGTSVECFGIENELKKLEACAEAKADFVMDLSTGGDLDVIRRKIIEASPIPLGTVPIYQAAISAERSRGSIDSMTDEDIFSAVQKHAEDGVDFMTVHCGVTFESIGRLKKNPRIMDVVSRGGALLVSWILKNKRENPLYENFDRLLDIARKHDVTLSLGDGMRPGALADSSDPAQIQELVILGQLTKRAWEAGVQVIIEGPGHVPLDQIEANVRMEKEICSGAPFYVLGPLVTDVAPGYDHITGAIGGALAAAAGVDFLCYVTPSEHLGLPDSHDVRDGVIASRIAAHAADIVKKIPGARDWDDAMSSARKNLDWEKQLEISIDPRRSREIRMSRTSGKSHTCSMCGEYCSLKVMRESFDEVKGNR